MQLIEHGDTPDDGAGKDSPNQYATFRRAKLDALPHTTALLSALLSLLVSIDFCRANSAAGSDPDVRSIVERSNRQKRTTRLSA
jgi:hypothetical protein